VLPVYDHDDLRRSFPPLMLELRRSLSSVLEQTPSRSRCTTASTACAWR
jgi:predicted component of type VI protein secretion system